MVTVSVPVVVSTWIRGVAVVEVASVQAYAVLLTIVEEAAAL